MTDESDCALVAIAPRLERAQWLVVGRPPGFLAGFQRTLSHVPEIAMVVTVVRSAAPDRSGHSPVTRSVALTLGLSSEWVGIPASVRLRRED
jgi:hypothetical protein